MNITAFSKLVARLLPLTLAIIPATYTADNGTTYYYTVCRLPNIELPVRTEEHLTPLGAYRAARQALLREAAARVRRLPPLPN